MIATLRCHQRTVNRKTPRGLGVVAWTTAGGLGDVTTGVIGVGAGGRIDPMYGVARLEIANEALPGKKELSRLSCAMLTPPDRRVTMPTSRSFPAEKMKRPAPESESTTFARLRAEVEVSISS
jgi:hypothetical protein